MSAKRDSSSTIIQYRSGNDGLAAHFSDLTGLRCEDPTLAQQQFKDDCNLNVIMERYERTGLLSHFREVAGSYGDFTHIRDYHSSLNTIISAQATFDALPADLRSRFDNDPGKFVDFCTDSKNLPELAKLGLLSPEAEARITNSAVAEGKGEQPKAAKSSVKASIKPLKGDEGDE